MTDKRTRFHNASLIRITQQKRHKRNIEMIIFSTSGPAYQMLLSVKNGLVAMEKGC